jgi:hypothetical protein
MIDFFGPNRVHVPLLFLASRFRHRIVYGFSEARTAKLGSPAFFSLRPPCHTAMFFFWFWLLPICGFSFPLYDFLLLRASPSYQDWFGGLLYRFMFFFGAGTRYTESLLAPCLSLYTTSVVCTRSRKKNTSLLERLALKAPFFTSFLSRLDYPFDCRLPL